MAPDSRPSIVDIFCGCGGLSEGFSQAGFEVLLGIDCDTWAIKTYNRHHGNRGRIRNVEDIDSNYIFTEICRKEIDVLVGGPPCQAFSSVSIAKWKSLGMPVTLRHPLNRLYKEFLRLVDETEPKFFVIENVARMLSISGGTVRKVIESELENKYKINFYIKDVANFGVPQHRRRAIVIGNKMGLRNPDIEGEYSYSDTSKKPYVTVYDAISDLPRIRSGQGKEFMKYPPKKYISDYARERRKCSDGVYNHTARIHNERDLKIFSMLRAGRWINHLPANFNPYRNDIFLDRYKKQPWNAPSSTIVAHISKDGLGFIHPDKMQNRSLTARESARLQSYDDRYIFEGPRTEQYVQIGNAVPPVFARAIATSIIDLLHVPLPVSKPSRLQSHTVL